MKPIPVFDPAEHASVPLGIGDLIQDNDLRHGIRILQVKSFQEGLRDRVVVADRDLGKLHQITILVDRIHLDGKPRRSGWSRIAISQGVS